VPEEYIHGTKCIAVIPNMLKAAFAWAEPMAKGVASCRTEKGWSAPAFFSTEGRQLRFQIGGQAADIVMLIMNDNGMETCGRASSNWVPDAALPPVRWAAHADASTDWKMRRRCSRIRGSEQCQPPLNAR